MSLFRGLEIAHKDAPAFVTKAGLPFAGMWVKGRPDEPAGRAAGAHPMVLVLTIGGETQVSAAVVQSVAVDVVDHSAGRRGHDDAVHLHQHKAVPDFLMADRIDRSRCFPGRPVAPLDKRNIHRIDDRDMAARQWDSRDIPHHFDRPSVPAPHPGIMCVPATTACQQVQ